MLKKIFVYVLLFVAIVFAFQNNPLTANAQTFVNGGVVIPQVLVEHLAVPAKSYNQGDTITGTFDVFNEADSAASDLYYTVSLVGDFNKDNFPQTMYQRGDPVGPISVDAVATKSFQFSYILPANVAGTNLGLQVRVQTKTGTAKGWQNVQFAVKGTASYVDVNSVSVLVNKTKYSAQAGPVVKQGDTASVEISISNPTKQAFTLTPQMKIYDRIITGSPLSTQSLDAFTIAAQGKKTLSYDIPIKDLTPKVYDASIELVDASGVVRNQTIEFRFIMDGDLATIQSVSLVASTSTNAIAVVSVNYTGAPDDVTSSTRHQNGMGTISVKLTDESGNTVGQVMQDVSLDGIQNQVIPIKLTASTKTLQATVSLIKGDTTLSTYTSSPQPYIFNKPLLSMENILWASGILVLIIALVILALRFKKKKISNLPPNLPSSPQPNSTSNLPPVAPIVMLALLILAAYALFPTKTFAWVLTNSGSASANARIYPDTLSINLSTGLTLNPGQQFSLALAVSALACNNSLDNLTLTTYYLNVSNTFTVSHTASESNAADNCGSSHCTPSFDNTIDGGSYTAPTTPGAYKIYFHLENDWLKDGSNLVGLDSIDGYVDFTVTSPTPVGSLDVASCGSFSGWACDPDNYNTPLQIDFYKGGPAGSGGTFLASTIASTTRSDIASLCGGVAAHGFSYTLPTDLITGTQPIYAYAINIGNLTGGNPLLASAPKTISCASGKPLGYLDVINCSTVAGWTCDPSLYQAQIPVRLYKDGGITTGTLVNDANIVANTYRPDIGAAGICGDPNKVANASYHGFSVPLPNSLKDGQNHTIYAYGMDLPSSTYSDPALGNAGQTINCPTNNPFGYLDGAAADCSTVFGWACDADNFNAPVSVDIYEGGPAGTGTFLVRSTANQSRTDISAICGGNSQHGYVATLPSNLSDGQQHTFYAYGINLPNSSGSNQQLYTSPQTFTCQAPAISTINNLKSYDGQCDVSTNTHTVHITWDVLSQARSYVVERSDPGSGGTYHTVTGPAPVIASNTVDFTDTTSPQSGQTYSYRVKAYGTTGNLLVTSSPISVTVNPCPLPPSGFSSQYGSCDNTSNQIQVVLTWNTVSQATGYTVERGTSSSGPWTAVTGLGTTISNGVATFTDNPAQLTPSLTYYYHVKAYNSVGDTSSPSNVVSILVKSCTDLTLTGTCNNNAWQETLNWVPVDCSIHNGPPTLGYVAQISTNSSFSSGSSWSKPQQFLPPGTSSTAAPDNFSPPGLVLTAGTTYYAKVLCLPAGTASSVGTFIPQDCATPPTAVACRPTTQNNNSPASAQVGEQVTWVLDGAPPGTTSYHWQGTDVSADTTTGSFSVNYATIGKKLMSVTLPGGTSAIICTVPVGGFPVYAGQIFQPI